MTIRLTWEETTILIRVISDHRLLPHSEAADEASTWWVHDVGTSSISMERLLSTDLAFVPTLIAALVAFRISGKTHALR